MKSKHATSLTAAALAASLASCSEPAPPPDTAPRSATEPAQAAPRAQAPAPESAAAAPSADAELSLKVKQKLDGGQGSEAIASTGSVEVAASGGVVTLYGTVAAPSEKERAAQIAMGVEGVRSVVNNLVVVRGS